LKFPLKHLNKKELKAREEQFDLAEDLIARILASILVIAIIWNLVIPTLLAT